jgi:hypothetical protein
MQRMEGMKEEGRKEGQTNSRKEKERKKDKEGR